MVVRVATVALAGVEARDVDVQVQISPGLPAFTIVGLPDKAIGESRERVRGALVACGLSLPPKRITINLAPADLPKEGSQFDLPIALGIMAAIGALSIDALQGYVILGELALDGSVMGVTGILPSAIAALGKNFGLICPEANGSEAAWAGETLDIIAAPHLISFVNHFSGQQTLSRPEPKAYHVAPYNNDLKDIKGQAVAKRVLEIAAAGGHNLLFVGPPGAGKSMLASRLPTILPPLEPDELLEISMIQSVAGLINRGGLSNQRPFRTPHHSATMAAMVGGGAKATPGEVALAHNGVLFLDELPEFSPQVLDGLRQPIESGQTSIARANYRINYPSRFQLVAAMNPCRCGRAGEPGFTCRRGERCASDYQARISGPLLDRLDLFLGVPAVSAADLSLPAPKEGSKEIALRVAKARAHQNNRYQTLKRPDIHTNALCPSDLIEATVRLDQESRTLLEEAAEKMKLTARGYHRVLRVARTIADLEGEVHTHKPHIAEAISYRASADGALVHLNA